MAVITKFIVERNGVERMTFASKQEADAYDKMLDTADVLQEWLSAQLLELPEECVEPLSLAMAKHKDELLALLSGKAVKSKSKEVTDKEKKAPELSVVEAEKAA